MDRKKLKSDYKNKIFKMGVFQIKNNVNGKIYIGSSMNLEKIWNRHEFQLKTGAHPNLELQKDWNEMGAENFSFSIIDELKPKEDNEDLSGEVKDLEEMRIDELQPFGEKGYN